MKEVEKLKNKLKRAKWLNKHLNKVILGVGIPATVIGQIFAPIVPLVGLIFTFIAFATYISLGLIWLNKYQDLEYVHLLEKELYYAEHANEQQVHILTSAITQQRNYLKQIAEKRSKCKTFKDSKQIEQLSKEESRVTSLISDLVKIKAVTQKVCMEKQTEIEENTANQEVKNLEI